MKITGLTGRLRRSATAVAAAGTAVVAAIGVGLVAPTPAEAIVGGVAAASGDAPYAVSLQTTSHFCGGTLLNPGTVLTTASCVAGIPPTRMKIRYGSLNQGSGGATAQVRQVVVHPACRGGSHDNDIAMVHTATPVLNITPALLPRPATTPPPAPS